MAYANLTYGITNIQNLNNGSININGTTAINISTDANGNTILIGTGAAQKLITLGSSNTSSQTTIVSGASGAVNLNSNGGGLTIISSTGALNISNDAAATTINIGTGGGVKGITLGSTNTTSSTKIQSGSGGTILAGYTGLVYANNASAVTTYAGGTTGNILVDNGTSWTSQAPGMNFIGTLTPSNVASVAFTSSQITSTYSSYLIVFSNVVPVSNAVDLQCLMSTNNGGVYLATNYSSGINNNQFNSATLANANATTFIYLAVSIDNTAGQGCSGYAYFYGLPATAPKFMTGATVGIHTASLFNYNTFAFQSGTTAVNNIKFQFSTGNISTGTISLYGIH